MNYLAVFLLALAPVLSGCMSPGGGLDFGATADEVALVRLDIADVATVAEPELQEDLSRLAAALEQVELMLRAADVGGPVVDLRSAVVAAQGVVELLPQSEATVAAKILLRRVAARLPSTPDPVL